MKTMAIEYPISHPLLSIEKRIASFLYQVILTITKAPWLIALALALTLGLLQTVIFYFPILIIRKRAERALGELIVNLEKVDERELMLLHTDLEDTKERLLSILDVSEKSLVFKPLNIEFSKMLAAFTEAEKNVFKHVYPDYDKALTNQQIAELNEAFKPWDGEQHKQLLSHG